ncbi:sensor histidine kinase [Cryobacterium soli]|uniref:sensor histidine kinase n=1 Tax=Cryobacterium soli TaxID=2220095 RepID=UPI000E723538|nr:ATP-binding protein [Cryobacterium soli]
MDGHIRFATSILSRLGEELNPNIDQGILELVKNAYDADALECTVSLIRDENNLPRITVSDDGEGMNSADIVDGWLVLGSSKKTTGQVTALGRRPAGNKGLGRLAALRLGRQAHMTSRPSSSNSRFEVHFDWDAFDRASTVDETTVVVAENTDHTDFRGTLIEIGDLRKPIGRVEVKRLVRSLVLLSDPFGEDQNSFRPHLYAPEFADLTRVVEDHYFSEADYHLSAVLSEGKLTAQVSDWRGNALYKAEHAELRVKANGSLYDAPNLHFDLWAFSLDGATFSTRSASLGEVKEWLRSFGGVHVYSNGLRVSPYGNAGNDWLEMNLARARNPEFRPSTNNSIGRVKVDDVEGVLVQNTNRSGFIESAEFDAIREAATDAMDWMARQRLNTAEQRRRTAVKENATAAQGTRQDVRQQIAEISDKQKKREVETAFAKYDKAREKETDSLRREVQLYRTLSTAGITSATFAHESNGNPLKVIAYSTNAIRFGLQRDIKPAYEAKYAAPIDSILNATASLNVLSAATLSLINPDKRRVAKVGLHSVIESVVATYQPFLTGRSVTVSLELAPGRPFVRGTDAALESVITNLINNSLSAFERINIPKRMIGISSRVLDGMWELTVADNGPGIEGIAVKDIWLPGETRRDGGTGLGLTIVRDAVSDLGGTVEASAHGQLGGATFVVRLTLLGVDDE